MFGLYKDFNPQEGQSYGSGWLKKIWICNGLFYDIYEKIFKNGVDSEWLG